MIWLSTFSVAASAAATDRVYWMERCVNLLLVAAQVITPATMARAIALMIITSIRAVPFWFGC